MTIEILLSKVSMVEAGRVQNKKIFDKYTQLLSSENKKPSERSVDFHSPRLIVHCIALRFIKKT